MQERGKLREDGKKIAERGRGVKPQSKDISQSDHCHDSDLKDILIMIS